MTYWIKKYLFNNEGAVTVDWVVIAGFAIAMALSVATALSPSMEKQGTGIVSRANITTTF